MLRNDILLLISSSGVYLSDTGSDISHLHFLAIEIHSCLDDFLLTRDTFEN